MWWGHPMTQRSAETGKVVRIQWSKVTVDLEKVAGRGEGGIRLTAVRFRRRQSLIGSMLERSGHFRILGLCSTMSEIAGFALP